MIIVVVIVVVVVVDDVVVVASVRACFSNLHLSLICQAVAVVVQQSTTFW